MLSTKVGRLLARPTAMSTAPRATSARRGWPGFATTHGTACSPPWRQASAGSASTAIDIALIHDPDDHGPEALDGAYPALAELRAEGVIGAVGVGMNQVEMLEWFLPRADLDCVLMAGRYTLLDTRAAVSLFPECQRRGVGVLAAGVFNSGVLVDPAPGATYDYQPAAADVMDRARRIGAACARHGLPIGAVALRFTLRHPAVTAAVVGARSPAEIAADAGYLAATSRTSCSTSWPPRG